MSNDPKKTDTSEDDEQHIDPEPLAIDGDAINDFIDRNERNERNPEERTIKSQVQPPQ